MLQLVIYWQNKCVYFHFLATEKMLRFVLTLPSLTEEFTESKNKNKSKIQSVTYPYDYGPSRHAMTMSRTEGCHLITLLKILNRLFEAEKN